MIRLSRLCAGYFGKTVIQEVTMEFLPGKVTVLLGPNGSGKSTLLKASLGLLPLTGGEVLYDDVDIRRLKRRQIAQKAAFLTQSRNTPSIQALRMVLHGRFPYLTYPRHYGGQDYAIARSAMDATGSRQHENTNVSLLSGGQRQGVYLAMALAQDTGTLFMDEPTTYLDISRQFQMMHTARSWPGREKRWCWYCTTSVWRCGRRTALRCCRRAGCYAATNRMPSTKAVFWNKYSGWGYTVWIPLTACSIIVSRGGFPAGSLKNVRTHKVIGYIPGVGLHKQEYSFRRL